MARDNWPLINRLKRAAKKINFIINFNVVRTFKMTASILGRSRSSSMTTPGRLSFNDRPGLKAAAHFYCSSDEDEGAAATYCASAKSSSRGSSSRELHRTTSCPVSDDQDVDQRADAFIANFYKQLRMERQVSLQLRYCRGNSFDSGGLRSP